MAFRIPEGMKNLLIMTAKDSSLRSGWHDGRRFVVYSTLNEKYSLSFCPHFSSTKVTHTHVSQYLYMSISDVYNRKASSY